MGAAQQTVEQLLRDLCDLKDMQIGTGSGDGLFTTTYEAKHGAPHFFSLGEHGFWLGLDSEQWRLFAKLDAIRRVRFVRAPALACARRPEDPQIAGEESLAVHLVGQSDHASLFFAFGWLYDEQDQPIAARFARWEALRAKYGGCDELRVQNGRLIPLAAGEK
jgi:hypothetical protein